MRPAPRVSVLMSVYNGGRFLMPAVGSVLAGAMPDLELVVVDNCSTDGSRQWLRNVADSRLRLVENATDLGQTGALNVGLAACAAPVVARLDADDLAEPDRLGWQLEALERSPRLGLVGGQAIRVDADDRVLSRTRLPTGPDAVAAVMTVANPFVHSGICFRRDAAMRAGAYPADFKVAQDYALWSALLRAGWLVDNDRRVACRLRIHGGQVTASALGARESGEALTVAALNQAWAMDLAAPDMELARPLQDLWLGRPGPPVGESLSRLLAAPRLSRAGKARLALLLAGAAGGGRLGTALRLLGRALALSPGEVARPAAYGAIAKLVRTALRAY